MEPLASTEHLSVAAPASRYFATYNYQLPAIDEDALHAVNRARAQRREEVEANKNREQRISIARNYLSKFGSPMAPYAAVIVDTADRCGGNYKSLIAIARVESGLGKHPYRLYNPYGYLNNVQYSGWSEALNKLSCRISQQYLSKYGTDFRAMGKIYASNPAWGDKVAAVYYGI